MSTSVWAAFSFMASTAAVATAQEATDEFRVTMLLMAGTGFGITACISSFQKHERKGIIFGRALLAFVGGVASPLFVDYCVPWNLSSLPYAVPPLFGFIAAVFCFYPGFGWIKLTAKNEDRTAEALDDMGKRIVKRKLGGDETTDSTD